MKVRANYLLLLHLTLILLLAVPAVASPPITYKLMQVKDGDTVVISPIEGGQFFICRLYGIDAPETPKNGKSGQPYGAESTKELKELILGIL
jgi:endonuclease YncB( thermonuclease family)